MTNTRKVIQDVTIDATSYATWETTWDAIDYFISNTMWNVARDTTWDALDEEGKAL